MAVLKKACSALVVAGLLVSVPAAAAQRKPASAPSDVRTSAKIKKGEKAVDTAVIVVGALAVGAAAYGIAKAVEGAPASP
ncbi:MULTISPECIES: hypothetical protein [Novosphingobium]|jgi:hypothetical protein|uniref:Integral membrane protein n=1 Tax=Novosphingobium subterraneum TaxID=48936 RepID=A0A0B8ZGE2_9SPHN|nr:MULTISPECIES: hypothetical protein [Novosphingobium]KHS42075.1 hypothetical protein NJ75_04441 [Novosphingobium subterraneum]QOV96290.1 hypothetical protein IM701_18510 [Novosphingobium sp. ES2-1]